MNYQNFLSIVRLSMRENDNGHQIGCVKKLIYAFSATALIDRSIRTAKRRICESCKNVCEREKKFGRFYDLILLDI